jgi:ribonuclease HII
MIDIEYFKHYQYLIGCDEVGRGPIAGPVNGCAVRMQNDHAFLQQLMDLGVTDSKKLTTKKRRLILEKLGITLSQLECFKLFQLENFCFVLWEHSPQEIDEMNILQASLSCMSQAALKIMQPQSLTLIDGNQKFRNFDYPCETITKGDSKSLAIALASIIAKEFRDEKMIELDKQYPGYGLAKHAGYPTKAHKEAVKSLGVTPIHRKSFKGVKEYVQGFPVRS